jgi:citrate lyase beta subunit
LSQSTSPGLPGPALLFVPADDERKAANAIRARPDAYEEAEGEGRGVTEVHGEMVDLAVVERARRILVTER